MLQESARIISVTEIARGIWQARLRSPGIASTANPGQFINILPSPDWANVMRRPMSIASQADDQISIIFKVVGRGSKIMSGWSPDDQVDIIGPLGNSWSGYDSHFPVLIGGGVGIAPILNLHHHLTTLSIDHILIFGARTAAEHFMAHQPESGIILTTDDGSLGVKGTVMNGIGNNLSAIKSHLPIKLFACGPPVMNDAVKDFAITNAIRCDIALEAVMACGFGNCQGCAVELNTSTSLSHSYHEKYALVCQQGPIFNAEDLK